MIAVSRVKSEDRIVEKIRALATTSPGLTIGPGDDAAVVARAAGLLAATTDMLVEGVDFLPDRLKIESKFLQYVDGEALTQPDQTQQQMLGPDEIMVGPFGLLARQEERLLRPRG